MHTYMHRIFLPHTYVGINVCNSVATLTCAYLQIPFNAEINLQKEEMSIDWKAKRSFFNVGLLGLWICY